MEGEGAGINMGTEHRQGPSMSKSALLLSGCLAWAHPRAKWYDEKHTDTTDRDIGTEFHRQIDSYIRGADVGQEPNEVTEER